MELSNKLAFLKCYFCCKNFNKLQLIEMNSNTVLINDEEVTYRDLVFDICLFKLESSKNNYVCGECNNNLLLFHFFKRDTNKYRNFREHLEKLEILARLENFLNEVGDLSLLHINENISEFSVTFHEGTITQEEVLVSTLKEEETTEIENLEEAELIEYDSGEFVSQEVEADLEPQLIKLNSSERTDLSSDNSTSKLEWIKVETKHCQIKKGRETEYMCYICFASFKNSISMSSHLENAHLHLENEIMDEVETEELNYQLRVSRYIVVSANGEEEKWCCSICREKRVFSNEKAFKLHFRIAHKSLSVNPELQHDNTWFEDSNQDNYHDRLNIHDAEYETEYLISEEEFHSTKKRKLNTLNDLSEEQINWIRKEVAAGEKLRGRKKTYCCTVCGCELTTQASLTRHLRDIHVLRNENNEKTVLKNEVISSKLVIDTSNGSETIFKCQRCKNDRIYKSEQSFKLHLRMTHIRTTKVDTSFVAACKTTIIDGGRARDAWKCPECLRIFRHRDTLRNHIKLEHPKMTDEAVNTMETIAKDEMSKVRSRIAEKLEHKISENLSNLCSECGLKFITSRHHFKPKVHRDCHEVFKTIAPHSPRFKCDSCRTVFNGEVSYEAHLMVHDTDECGMIIEAEGLAQHGASFYKDATGDADEAVDEAVWKCAHCNVRYFDENDCFVHVMLLHSSPLCCFIDNRKFSGSAGMSKYVQHMRNKHPELFPELSYPCGVCKLEFPTIYEKLAHQKVCDSKKFQCDHCDKRFSKKHQIQSHILYELGLSGFSCEFCGKRCKTLSDLNIHINVHSLARPYKCSQCPKTFKTPCARSTHMESHNIEGVYCEICGVKLASRTLYQRHKRFQHNQEFREKQMEKYFCTTCDKPFLRSSIYKQHMKQVHNVD